MSLKPQNLVQAAQADLQRRERNGGFDPKARRRNKVPFEHYAFHRKHVRRAMSVEDVLRLAVADPLIGQVSGKKNTVLIYSNVPLLQAALQLAKAGDAK